MAGPTPASKKISDVLPNLKQEGIKYLVGAAKGGISLQVASVTQSGASPFAVTFASLGIKDMADSNYVPIVVGPNGDETADLATRTVTGFSIKNGANAEVLAVVIVGRIKGQAT